MHDDAATPAALRLEPIDEHRFAAPNEGNAEIHDVVFGGQLLGQSIIAAARCHPDQHVRSIQTIFARTARVSGATELQVDPMHAGRSFASDSITAWQGDRLCARSLVLLDVDEPDLIRHAPSMPDVAGPEQSADGGARGAVFPGSELRIVDDVDLYSLDAPVASADLFLWTRFADAPDDVTINQAVLAWATDGYLIATRDAPARGDQPERRASNRVHRRARADRGVPRAVHHPRLAADRASQHGRRSRPYVRSGRGVPSRRHAGRIVHADQHDPRHARPGGRRRASTSLRARPLTLGPLRTGARNPGLDRSNFNGRDSSSTSL